MRAGILAWSTFSGILLGLFAGIVLGTVALLAGELLPARWELARVRAAVIVLCLVVLPLVGAVLGFLEGRLKLS